MDTNDSSKPEDADGRWIKHGRLLLRPKHFLEYLIRSQLYTIGEAAETKKKEDVHAPPKNIGHLKAAEKVSILLDLAGVPLSLCLGLIGVVCVFAAEGEDGHNERDERNCQEIGVSTGVFDLRRM